MSAMKEIQRHFPAIGSGCRFYPKLNEYISHGKLGGKKWRRDYRSFSTVESMKGILGCDINKVARCSFNDRENNPLKHSKNGKLRKNQKEVIDGLDDREKWKDYEGVLVNFIGEHDMWSSNDTEGIYLITFDNHIVKIGMTETSFAKRFQSYCCGTRRAMQKGTPSTTNFIICEVIYTALQLDINVDIYGINLPKEKKTIKAYGKETVCPVSVVRGHEEIITNIFKEKNHNEKPLLCVQHASNTS